jgi:hypothetical protein
MRWGIKKPWTLSGPRLVASKWRLCRRLSARGGRRSPIASAAARRHSWESVRDAHGEVHRLRSILVWWFGGRTARRSSDCFTWPPREDTTRPAPVSRLAGVVVRQANVAGRAAPLDRQAQAAASRSAIPQRVSSSPRKLLRYEPIAKIASHQGGHVTMGAEFLRQSGLEPVAFEGDCRLTRSDGAPVRIENRDSLTRGPRITDCPSSELSPSPRQRR